MAVMRLQKFLSRAQVASRRAGEAMIRAGRVRVNGRVVTEMGAQVEPARDRVEVDGRSVSIGEPIWVALHKPPGYVTTRSDPHGRRTVYDLLPPELSGLFHVGRLDAASEGLLLLTNQGDVAYRLLHPRYGIDRVYDVVVEGELSEEDARRLRDGVDLSDGPARVRALERRPSPKPGHARARVTMAEGRKREVRRLFIAIGHPVSRLVRRRYGPIRLGRLPRGEWRRLEQTEVAALERAGAD